MNFLIKDTLKKISPDHKFIVLLKKEPEILQSKEVRTLDYLLNGLISDQVRNFEVRYPTILNGSNFHQELNVVLFLGQRSEAQKYLLSVFSDAAEENILFLEDSETTAK